MYIEHFLPTVLKFEKTKIKEKEERNGHFKESKIGNATSDLSIVASHTLMSSNIFPQPFEEKEVRSGPIF